MKKSNLVKIILLAGSLLLQLTTFSHHSLGGAGAVDLSFDPGSGVNPPVDAMALQPNGKVLIGNVMTFINGTNRYATMRLNADGTLDSAFVSGGFNPDLAAIQTIDYCEPGYQCFPIPIGYTALVVQSDEKVILAGDYSESACHEAGCDYTYRTFLARFHANGNRDLSFNATKDVAVRALAVQPDGKVVIGGGFEFVGGTNRNGIARINSAGSLDLSFNPGTGANGEVLAISLQSDGKVIIGGTFTSVNGTNRNGIARLNANGSLDSSFNPGTGANNWVSAAVVQLDGKVLIGGHFTTVNGTNRNRIARLNANGSLDLNFNPGTGANGAVLSIALQPDGKTLIGGTFTAVNEVVRPYVARLYGDTAAPSLNIARFNSLMIISWPSPSTDCVLQQNTNLNTSNWTTPPETVTDNGTTKSITISPASGNRFFRLFKL